MVKSKPTIVFELTDQQLKVVESSVTLKGKAVQYADIININGESDEQIKDQLRQLIVRRNIHPAQTESIIVIPRQMATLRYLSLPSQDTAELKKMVELQALSQVPFAQGEIIVDYTILSKDEDGYTKILAIIIPRVFIEKCIKIFIGAGLMPHVLTLSSWGILNWHINHFRMQEEMFNDVVMIINSGKDMSEVCFYYQRELIFSRPLNMGTQHLRDEGLREYIKQIELTVQGFEKEKLARKIDHIILLSREESVASLTGELQSLFDARVMVIDPIDDILTVKSFQWPPAVQDDPASVTALAGFAVAQNRKIVNLMPSEIKERKLSKIKKNRLVRLVILLGVLMVCVYLNFYIIKTKKEKVQQTLLSEQKTITDQVSKLKSKSQYVQLMSKQVGSNKYIVHIMEALYRIIPEAIQLTTLNYSQGSVILQGFTNDASLINQMQKAIQSDSLFVRVSLDYVNKRKRRNEEDSYFKMTIYLREKGS